MPWVYALYHAPTPGSGLLHPPHEGRHLEALGRVTARRPPGVAGPPTGRWSGPAARRPPARPRRRRGRRAMVSARGSRRRSAKRCSCQGPRASGRRCPGRRPGRPADRSPVAITVSFTWPSSVGSMTAPKMMFASSWAASWMMVDASWTSISDRSDPPVTLMITPRAPSIDASSRSGLEIAFLAASTARVVAVADAGAHHGDAHAGHDRLHVGEIEVDQAGQQDEVRDALDGLAQHVVDGGERVEQRRLAVDRAQQALVRDRDDAVDAVAQLLEARAPPGWRACGPRT